MCCFRLCLRCIKPEADSWTCFIVALSSSSQSYATVLSAKHPQSALLLLLHLQPLQHPREDAVWLAPVDVISVNVAAPAILRKNAQWIKELPRRGGRLPHLIRLWDKCTLHAPQNDEQPQVDDPVGRTFSRIPGVLQLKTLLFAPIVQRFAKRSTDCWQKSNKWRKTASTNNPEKDTGWIRKETKNLDKRSNKHGSYTQRAYLCTVNFYALLQETQQGSLYAAGVIVSNDSGGQLPAATSSQWLRV